MKRFLILAIALAVLAGGARAGLGIRAGVNFTAISGQGLSAKANPGLTAGVTYRHQIVDNGMVGAELLFCRQRMDYSDSARDYSASMDYLRIPALARICFTEGALRPFIEGGADLGIRIRGHIASGADTTRIEDLSPVDACWILGGGAELGRRLSAGLRIQRSLFSIVDKEKFGDLRNLGVTLSAGLSF